MKFARIYYWPAVLKEERSLFCLVFRALFGFWASIIEELDTNSEVIKGRDRFLSTFFRNLVNEVALKSVSHKTLI